MSNVEPPVRIVYVIQDVNDSNFPVAVADSLDAAWVWIKSQRAWEGKQDPTRALNNGLADDHYAVAEVASYF